MFAITGHKGFQITFENGCTISVQFGPGNYTDSDIRDAPFHLPKSKDRWEAKTAEVAILLPNGEFYNIPMEPYNSDGVIVGWATVEDVCKLIDHARNIRTEVTA